MTTFFLFCRSQYFIFVGNDPYAQEMLQAMQRPVDKIAFGFQNNQAASHKDEVLAPVCLAAAAGCL